jgi:hypothetical protein
MYFTLIFNEIQRKKFPTAHFICSIIRFVEPDNYLQIMRMYMKASYTRKQ